MDQAAAAMADLVCACGHLAAVHVPHGAQHTGRCTGPCDCPAFTRRTRLPDALEEAPSGSAVKVSIDHRLPDRLLMLGGDPNLLRDEILDVIGKSMAAHPRSLQKRIGPSEIGTPCARRIGYKLAGAAEINRTDGWKATIGTAVHTWLEEAFARDNTLVTDVADTDTRWLLEAKVTAGHINGEDIDGRCDMYDRITATSLDWKVTSRAKIKSCRANGPGEQYRIQAHAYGNGWLAKGLPVDRVAVFFLPRDDTLRKDTVHMWSEPHDPSVAEAAFARASQIDTIVRAFGPAAPALLPTADAYCTWCPYFRPGATDLATACPGDPSVIQQHVAVLSADPFPGLGF